MSDLEKLKEIKIVDVAAALGFTVKRAGSYYTLKEHDSVRIDDKRNLYVRNSTGRGGSVIDFVSEFANLSIGDAIKFLSKDKNERKSLARINAKENKELKLPKEGNANNNVIAYLTKTRGLNYSLVKSFIDKKYLYQDENKNAVFVSYENGVPVFASLRGTNTYKKYVADIPGSDYSYCFFIGNGSQELIVTESVIDLMSVMQEKGGNEKAYDYLALSGTGKGEKAVLSHLKRSPYSVVRLCLDNDEAGRHAAEHIRELIEDAYPDITATLEFPAKGKDYNEQLLIEREEKERRIEL